MYLMVSLQTGRSESSHLLCSSVTLCGALELLWHCRPCALCVHGHGTSDWVE